MEGAAFVYLAVAAHQQNKLTQLARSSDQSHIPQHRNTFLDGSGATATQQRIFRRPDFSSYSSQFHKLKSRLAKLRSCEMPSGLLILYVPSNPAEAPQFVRVARKGIRVSSFLCPRSLYACVQNACPRFQCQALIRVSLILECM